MSGTKVVVKESVMSVDMQQDCADCAAHALYDSKLQGQNEIAQFIKEELDSKYGGPWHCIVGHAFGSCVGHDMSYFIYFEIDGVYVNIWKMNAARDTSQAAALGGRSSAIAQAAV